MNTLLKYHMQTLINCFLWQNNLYSYQKETYVIKLKKNFFVHLSKYSFLRLIDICFKILDFLFFCSSKIIFYRNEERFLSNKEVCVSFTIKSNIFVSKEFFNRINTYYFDKLWTSLPLEGSEKKISYIAKLPTYMHIQKILIRK